MVPNRINHALKNFEFYTGERSDDETLFKDGITIIGESNEVQDMPFGSR